MTTTAPDPIYTGTIRSHAAAIARHPLADLRAFPHIAELREELQGILIQTLPQDGDIPSYLDDPEDDAGVAAQATTAKSCARVLSQTTDEQFARMEPDALREADYTVVSYVEGMRHHFIGDAETDPTYSTVGDVEALDARLGFTPSSEAEGAAKRVGAILQALSALDWGGVHEEPARGVEVLLGRALREAREFLSCGLESEADRAGRSDVEAVVTMLTGEVGVPSVLSEEEQGRLDDLVHGEVSQIGSAVNNSGVAGQVEFLRERGWSLAEVVKALRG